MCLICVRNFVLGIAAAVNLAGGAWAQDYPTKPIRIIVPFAPGGLADTSARAVAEKLSARLGKSVDAGTVWCADPRRSRALGEGCQAGRDPRRVTRQST